jgi:rhodanese-related sulfurtransferase
MTTPHEQISIDELIEMQASGQKFQLIDVRAEEHAEGHIPFSQLIPLDEIPKHQHQLNTDGPIVVYCRSGKRSAMAQQQLAELGYTVINLIGGIQAYHTKVSNE